MNISVNRLPDLTWNRLNMNEGVIKDAEKILLATADISTEFEDMPEGVSCRRIEKNEAAAILAAAPEQPTEKYVAGKIPTYHAQRFATGVGKEYDDIITEQAERVEFLEVAAGTRAEEPILWHIDFYKNNYAVSQQIIHVGKNASLKLVMDYSSEKSDSGFAGISTKIILEEGAKLDLSKVQMLGAGYFHVDDLGISLDKDAEMIFNQMELGGNEVYVGTQAELIGDKSRFTSRTAYLSRKKGHIDVSYNAVQRGKKTNVDMSFDGVLKDEATKIWRGTIDFRNGSSGSVGHENENVLLLDENIENKSMPLILCEEEDVEGQHGSTIGRLADDILFYFGTRGVDEKAAEEMMVHARFGTVSREIPNEEIRGKIDYYLRSIL